MTTTGTPPAPDRGAVIAVHGVGNQEAGATARAILNNLIRGTVAL